MPNVSETLKQATEILQSSGIAEPRREANSLLTLALEKDRTYLIAHPEHELSTDEEIKFREFLLRRASREPLQYIAGRQEFCGLDFEISPDVLIPRPETEMIVEAAVEILREIENTRFCEVGVGSGCISISILRQVETATAIGLDVSENALWIAGKNAERHDVSEKLNLKISDVFAALENEKFDLIVSNPPYVPGEDFASLQAEVRDFEPRVALTDEKNGLSIIEKIVAGSSEFLRSGGYLLMEIGFNQANGVKEFFDRRVWQNLEILPDLQGIPRMVKAKIT